MKQLLKQISIFAGILFLSSSSVSAIDEMRKGFLFGIGAGFSPISKISADIICDGEKTKARLTRNGSVVNLMLGYGWNESNSLVLELHSTRIEWKAGDLSCSKEPCPQGAYCFSFSISSNQSWSANFIGPVWYHYYGPKEKSLVTMFGLGWETISVYNDGYKNEGLGILAGIGYEMNKGWIIQGRYNIGSSLSWSDNERRVSSISVLISKLWY